MKSFKNKNLQDCRPSARLLPLFATVLLLPLFPGAATAQEPTATYPQSVALMPYPQHRQQQTSAPFTLSAETPLCFHENPSPHLRAASERFRQRILRLQGIRLPQANLCTGLLAEKPGIELILTGKTQRENPHKLASLTPEAERYQLTITPTGIQLHADHEPGILRGLQTLSQQVSASIRARDPHQKTQTIRIDSQEIRDQPHYRWRGLMLDTVRHFFSVETIKRQLDGMAAAKLNVFHWHLTDDQGWRLESRAYPRLHQTAPGGNYYSRAQIQEIVAYAAARGIVVVPEIDMPGHASAIAHAYPELISAPGPYPPEDRWGVHKPLLNPANPAVIEFAEKIIAEVADLFPFEYVHIGGDEVDPEQWQQNPDIQAYMTARQLPDSHALHNDFNNRLANILARHGRKMIGWDEILHPGLADGAMGQSWRGPDALGEIARAGHYGILSTGFYVDQPQYTSYHYRNAITPEPFTFAPIQRGEQWQTWQFSAPRKRGSPVTGSFTLVESTDGRLRGAITFSGKAPQVLHRLERLGPITRFRLDTWMGPLEARLILQQDTLQGEFLVGNAPYVPSGALVAASTREDATPVIPGSGDTLSPSQRRNILGGEAALWAEMVDERSIDLRLWPRTFAVAERLWSGPGVRSENDLYTRLEIVDHWAERALGLQHRHQQTAALQRIFPQHLQQAARNLSAVLEPAHYYHRHHEKSANETYSRRDPLDRFADSLPVESLALRDLRIIGDSLQDDSARFNRQETLHNGIMHLWRGRAAANKILQTPDTVSQEILTLATLVQQQTDLSLLIITRYLKRQPFSEQEENTVRQQLASLKGIHHEVTLPATYTLEKFLDRLQFASPPQQITDSNHG